MTGSLAQEKAAVRAQVRKALAALPPARRALEEELVTAAVQDMPEWRAARTILLYRSVGTEMTTVGLGNAAWRAGKRVAFPRLVLDGRLELHRVAGWSDFGPGPHGIPEPSAKAPLVSAAEIDLALIPGVAFDAGGGRLGRGGGHFDRLMDAGGLRRAWGLALVCQVVARVPREDHDRAVERVIHAAAVGTR